MNDDYTHPESGRVYREGDPAARFARLTAALARQCRMYVDQYERQLEGHDYLTQHQEWPSDPDRIARLIAHTIAELDKSYSEIVSEINLPKYGIGSEDAEWQRKYGRG